MKIKLIRSATISLQYSGHSILIDPYFADQYSQPSYAEKSKNPLVGLPLSLAEIMAGIDTVIVSHLHSDHFDPVAQNYLPKTIPILCQDSDEYKIREMGFRNIHPIRDHCQLGNISIQRVMGKHGDGDVLKEMGITSGFLFNAPDESELYWAGDTILFDKITDLLLERKPKVIVTHSSGGVWGDGVKIIMDEVQTVEVCKLLPQSIVIATHMDSLDHCLVSRQQLREYADRNNIGRNQLFIPNDGGELVF